MTRITIEISDAMSETISKACDIAGLSKSELVRECIRDGIPHYLNEDNKEIDQSLVRDVFNKVLKKLENS